MNDVQELIKEIEAVRFPEDPDGRFTVVQEGSHYKVKFNGQTVMYRPNPDEQTTLPVTLPSTPSDPRWRENTMKVLISAQVFSEDPKKAGQAGLSEADQEERERKAHMRDLAAAGRATLAEKKKERDIATALVRDRAERLFGIIGVWKPAGYGHSGWRGTIAEIARVAFEWGTRMGLETLPTSASMSKDTWRKLYNAAPLDTSRVEFVRAFINHLEKAPNPARLYNEMVREMLGIGDQREPVAARVESPAPEVAPEPVAPEVEPEPVLVRSPADLTTTEIAALRKERDDAVAVAAAAVAENERLAASASSGADHADAEALRAIRNGNLPTLALEALGEMIGTPVLGHDEAIDSDLMDLLNEKRERSIAIAKRVLALELGATTGE